MHLYFVLVLLMICNRNDITSVGRWEFVKAFVEDFVAILVAIHFATPFATKNDRENFVEISSKISLLQLKFDEISTKFWTKFRQFFLWQNVFCHKENFVKTREGTTFCLVAKRFATTFCHQKKSLKFRQRFRCFNSSSDEILTKFWRKNLWQNLVAKRFAPKHPTKSLTKFWRNENERNNKENPYTRTYCKW